MKKNPAEALTFRDLEVECTRLEAKEKRQAAALARTTRLIDSLRQMQAKLAP